jgi:hypothetical protein
MRAEVIEAVRSLADPRYQQRVWIRHEYPHEGFYDDLTMNVNVLFDDTSVLDDPAKSVGVALYEEETEVMRALAAVLSPLVDELEDASDAAYLAHPSWATVVARAQAAYALLHRNGSGDGQDPPST